MLDVFYDGKVNEKDEAVLVEDGYVNLVGSNEDVLMQSIGANLVDLGKHRLKGAKSLTEAGLLREDILKSMEILAAQGVCNITTNLPYSRLREVEEVYRSGDAPLRTNIMIEANSLEDIKKYTLEYREDPWLTLGSLFVRDLSDIPGWIRKANEVKTGLVFYCEEEDYPKVKPYLNKYHKALFGRKVEEKKEIKVNDVADFAVVDSNGKVMMSVVEGYIVYRRGV